VSPSPVQLEAIPHRVHRLETAPTKYIDIKSTTVYVPSSELGLSHPSLASECAPPPGTKWGEGGGVHVGHTRLAGEGLGESQF